MLETPKASCYYLGNKAEDITMANQQERRDAAIYLAAMIQGEGSVLLYPNRKGGRSHQSTTVLARVVIYNSDEAVLDQVGHYCLMLEAGHYRYRNDRLQNWQKKPMGVVMINGFKRLSRFLPHVIRFLVGEKRRIAEAVLALSVARSAVSVR